MQATGLMLNDLQRQAAEADRPVLLMAGAGTGKTRTLSFRVARLLKEGLCAPEEILCLTFTNRACREMAERVSAQVPDAREVTIRTVHGFCAGLLRGAPGKLMEVDRDFAVCDAEDAMALLGETAADVVGRVPDASSLRRLQNYVEYLKTLGLSASRPLRALAAEAAASHREVLEKFCTDYEGITDRKFLNFLIKYGGSLAELYNRKLRTNNLLDFSDLLLKANELMDDPEFYGVWGERFRQVLVDEVQDVSLGEYRFLRRFLGAAVPLLCGDFNQTIYQWRGSDPQALLACYRAEFHPLEITLTKNYRSAPGLLAAAERFLSRDPERPGQKAPAALAAGDIVLRSFPTPQEEARFIYRELSALKPQDASRAAVIVRTNRACAGLCALLREEQARDPGGSPVGFMPGGEFRLFKRPEVKDLLACLGLAANPRDNEGLSRVLLRLVKGVGESAVRGIAAAYQRGEGVALSDWLDIRTRRTGDFFEPLLDALEKGNVVVFDVESTGVDVWQDEIVQLAAARLGPDGRVSARFERFLRPARPVGGSQRVHGFSDEFLREHGQDPAGALRDFLEFAGDAVLVGHNVLFDLTITGENLRRLGVPGRLSPVWYDTLDLSRRFLPKLTDHKLVTVAAALGAANDPTHNAMDDILATADVLRILTEGYLRPGAPLRRDRYQSLMQKLEPLCRAADELKSCPQLGAADLAEKCIGLFRLEERCQTEEARENLRLFCRFARESIDPALPQARQLQSLAEFAALSASELDRMGKNSGRVPVITAHQSKGCEFDYVFLPVLQEGVFPGFRAVREGDLREEARVFYVSFTRAKKRVWLTYAKQNDFGRPAKPSRFIGMLLTSESESS